MFHNFTQPSISLFGKCEKGVYLQRRLQHWSRSVSSKASSCRLSKLAIAMDLESKESSERWIDCSLNGFVEDGMVWLTRRWWKRRGNGSRRWTEMRSKCPRGGNLIPPRSWTSPIPRDLTSQSMDCLNHLRNAEITCSNANLWLRLIQSHACWIMLRD